MDYEKGDCATCHQPIKVASPSARFCRECWDTDYRKFKFTSPPLRPSVKQVAESRQAAIAAAMAADDCSD